LVDANYFLGHPVYQSLFSNTLVGAYTNIYMSPW